MAYKMNLSIDELTENVKSLSSPEVKEGFSKLSVNSVKDNFINIIKNRYFCFEGVAKRSEYWQYALMLVVIDIVVSVVWTILGIVGLGIVGYILHGVINLALLCPSLGVGARRLHDTGKSGWLQLIAIIPIIGWLIVLVLMLGKSVECECGCGCGCEQK